MFSDPIKIIDSVNLPSNFIVADFGAGSGHYTKYLAKILTEGKVFAVEIQKDLADSLEKDLTEKEHQNVSVVWGDIEKINGSRLRDKTMDVVFLCNVLFQSKTDESRDMVIKEIKRVLKEKGLIVFIEWSDSYQNMGPKKEDVLPKEKAIEILGNNDFVIDKEIDAGSHHYGLIAKIS